MYTLSISLACMTSFVSYLCVCVCVWAQTVGMWSGLARLAGGGVLCAQHGWSSGLDWLVHNCITLYLSGCKAIVVETSEEVSIVCVCVYEGHRCL